MFYAEYSAVGCEIARGDNCPHLKPDGVRSQDYIEWYLLIYIEVVFTVRRIIVLVSPDYCLFDTS